MGSVLSKKCSASKIDAIGIEKVESTPFSSIEKEVDVKSKNFTSIDDESKKKILEYEGFKDINAELLESVRFAPGGIGCEDDIMEENQKNVDKENLFELKPEQKLNKGHFGQVYTLNSKKYPYGKNKEIVVKSMQLKKNGSKSGTAVSLLQALAELDFHIKAKAHVDQQEFSHVGIVDIYKYAVVDLTNDRVIFFMEKTDTKSLHEEINAKISKSESTTLKNFLEKQEEFSLELFNLVDGLHKKHMYPTDIKMENAGFSRYENDVVKLNLYDLGPNFVERTRQGYTFLPHELALRVKSTDALNLMEKPKEDNSYNNSYFETQILLLDVCSAGRFRKLKSTTSYDVCNYQKKENLKLNITCTRMENAFKKFRDVFENMQNPKFNDDKIKFEEKQIIRPYSCKRH